CSRSASIITVTVYVPANRISLVSQYATPESPHCCVTIRPPVVVQLRNSLAPFSVNRLVASNLTGLPAVTFLSESVNEQRGALLCRGCGGDALCPHNGATSIARTHKALNRL